LVIERLLFLARAYSNPQFILWKALHAYKQTTLGAFAAWPHGNQVID